MRTFPLRRAGLLIAAVALVIVAGCKTVTTPQATSDITMSIQIKDYQVGTSPVAVHFSTGAGDTIEFVSGETVACNGSFLKYASNPVEQLFAYGSYVGEVPHQDAGGTYSFTYTPAKSAAITVPVQVISAPVVVSSPANNATIAIPKTGSLDIQYQPTTLANTTILAIVVDTRNSFFFTLPQSETGTLSIPAQKFADSNIQPGPGSLSLVRVTTNYPDGTPFHQVKVEYDNITRLQINWQ